MANEMRQSKETGGEITEGTAKHDHITQSPTP